MIYEYRFWTEWCDEAGRLWAEPHIFDAATDARRAHKNALGWHWVRDKRYPSVSDLYSIAYKEDPATGKKREENRTIIQDGGVREFYETALSGLRETGEREPVSVARDTPPAVKESRSFDTPF